jgi:hypothetical protein
MTGSLDASGKIPFLPAHSISKLRIRKGAIFAHSPSGVYDMNLSYLSTFSTAITVNIPMYAIPDGEFYLAMRLFVLPFKEGVFSCRDFDPVHTHDLSQSQTRKQTRSITRTFVSIMKRRINGMLLSNVVTGPLNKPLKFVSPLSKIREKAQKVRQMKTNDQTHTHLEREEQPWVPWP